MSTISSPAATGWFSRLRVRKDVTEVLAAATPQEALHERRSPALAILASALRMPHGATPAALGAALAAGKACDLDLDPELVDDLGFPVMSARSGQAEDGLVRDEIADWLAANTSPDPYFGQEQWRALVLGTAVMRDLAGRAAAIWLAQDAAPPVLRLLAVLPEAWAAAQRQAACAWWQHVLLRSGWPAAQVDALDPEGMPPAALVARLAQQAQAAATPAATILLACASHIGQETVDRWSANGTLFTPAHPRGRVPGEGAAGLLLAQACGSPGQAQVSVAYEACDKAFASQKRLSPQRLAQLAERILEGTGIAPSDIAMIVADTGAQVRTVLELMEFGTAAAPHLDSTDDIVRLGAACGACDAVPFVAALAVACEAALERDAPLLCVGNDAPAYRALALVLPGPAPRDGA